MPISSVPREPGRLNREDSADAAFADARQQPFKTWPGNAITGATEIVIDDLNVAPTELLPACDEGVLASLTLKIVGNLMVSRIPKPFASSRAQ